MAQARIDFSSGWNPSSVWRPDRGCRSANLITSVCAESRIGFVPVPKTGTRVGCRRGAESRTVLHDENNMQQGKKDEVQPEIPSCRIFTRPGPFRHLLRQWLC